MILFFIFCYKISPIIFTITIIFCRHVTNITSRYKISPILGCRAPLGAMTITKLWAIFIYNHGSILVVWLRMYHLLSKCVPIYSNTTKYNSWTIYIIHIKKWPQFDVYEALFIKLTSTWECTWSWETLLLVFWQNKLQNFMFFSFNPFKPISPFRNFTLK